jgi:hypothetical protein
MGGMGKNDHSVHLMAFIKEYNPLWRINLWGKFFSVFFVQFPVTHFVSCHQHALLSFELLSVCHDSFTNCGNCKFSTLPPLNEN